ncbi:enoyl-CoA hydratase/carnithine racemase [Oikeobacillus pervagus]|uniref:Enoyl-CoA hydratase/carnithine racemase n=1 Tax=Oikeobacillus pervagus TaxID=1325931 RepID=A0AAJ1WIT4_9BACI|nr:enoyl-CoA hydratase [Oikeobacillus pervagus]MDQ0214743.1 enoyl-CoA hydratase/carnithine racemase [Oikeobacillus pervagus]
METKEKNETVLLQIKDSVALVTLNRPETLNALNVDMLKEFVLVLKDLSVREDVKIVVLKGEGRAFSSGGDIKGMLAELTSKEQFSSVMDTISELVMTLYTIPAVTISAIHGAAAGLGLSLALATDYVLCEENSKLAMNFIGIALIPDGGGHFLMERRVGEVKAKQIIWEGKVMSGVEAVSIGLVDQSIPKENFEEKVQEVIEAYKRKPLQAMIETKKILAELSRPTLLKALELEKQAQWKMRQTKDHKEGIQAFIEKRPPRFIGE